jgi:hypothetical protein
MFGWFAKKSFAQLDLTKDRTAFISLIAAAVKEFIRDERTKGFQPITRVDLRFDLTSEAYPRVWLELDDEPSGEPSTGRSQIHVIMERICKPWARPCHAVTDGKPVAVVWAGGRTVVKDEPSLYEAVGPYFVDLMMSLRKAGIFKPLRRAQKCYLGVSNNGGEFGWPHYDQRGPDNMV